MRNPDRIPKILSLLQQGWEKVPDWRFGQLIENLKRQSMNTFVVSIHIKINKK